MKKNLFLLITLIILSFSLAFADLVSIPLPKPKPIKFSDVTEKHWAYDYIMRMSEVAIDGFTDGTFRPEDNVTRAQFAKIIVLTLGLNHENTKYQPIFADVPESYWASSFIVAASKYLTGYADGNIITFEPEKPATRDDIAVAVVVASGLKNKSYNPDTIKRFKDYETISEDIRGYISIAVENKIINGYDSDDTFRPNEYITRAEVCKLMVKLLDVGVEAGESGDEVLVCQHSNTFQNYVSAGVAGHFIEIKCKDCGFVKGRSRSPVAHTFSSNNVCSKCSYKRIVPVMPDIEVGIVMKIRQQREDAYVNLDGEGYVKVDLKNSVIKTYEQLKQFQRNCIILFNRDADDCITIKATYTISDVFESSIVKERRDSILQVEGSLINGGIDLANKDDKNVVKYKDYPVFMINSQIDKNSFIEFLSVEKLGKGLEKGLYSKAYRIAPYDDPEVVFIIDIEGLSLKDVINRDGSVTYNEEPTSYLTDVNYDEKTATIDLGVNWNEYCYTWNTDSTVNENELLNNLKEHKRPFYYPSQRVLNYYYGEDSNHNLLGGAGDTKFSGRGAVMVAKKDDLNDNILITFNSPFASVKYDKNTDDLLMDDASKYRIIRGKIEGDSYTVTESVDILPGWLKAKEKGTKFSEFVKSEYVVVILKSNDLATCLIHVENDFSNYELKFDNKTLSIDLGPNWKDTLYYSYNNYVPSQRYLVYNDTSKNYGIGEIRKSTVPNVVYSCFLEGYLSDNIDSRLLAVHYKNGVKTVLVPNPFIVETTGLGRQNLLYEGNTISFKIKTLNKLSSVSYSWSNGKTITSQKDNMTLKVPSFGNQKDYHWLNVKITDIYGNSKIKSYHILNKKMYDLDFDFYAVSAPIESSNYNGTKQNTIKLTDFNGNTEKFIFTSYANIPDELLKKSVEEKHEPLVVAVGLDKNKEIGSIVVLKNDTGFLRGDNRDYTIYGNKIIKNFSSGFSDELFNGRFVRRDPYTPVNFNGFKNIKVVLSEPYYGDPSGLTFKAMSLVTYNDLSGKVIGMADDDNVLYLFVYNIFPSVPTQPPKTPTHAPTKTPIRTTGMPTKAPTKTPAITPTLPPTKAPTKTPIRTTGMPTKTPVKITPTPTATLTIKPIKITFNRNESNNKFSKTDTATLKLSRALAQGEQFTVQFNAYNHKNAQKSYSLINVNKLKGNQYIFSGSELYKFIDEDKDKFFEGKDPIKYNLHYYVYNHNIPGGNKIITQGKLDIELADSKLSIISNNITSFKATDTIKITLNRPPKSTETVKAYLQYTDDGYAGGIPNVTIKDNVVSIRAESIIELYNAMRVGDHIPDNKGVFTIKIYASTKNTDTVLKIYKMTLKTSTATPVPSKPGKVAVIDIIGEVGK